MGGREAGSQHVAAGEEYFVCVGVFVVVVEKPARPDLDLEEPPGADTVLQRDEFRFGGGDDLGGAGCVTPGAGVGFDHNRAGPVREGDVCGAAAVLVDFDPGSVVSNGR